MSSDEENENYIIEAERKAKQNYLSEEILDSNYDPDLFMMYCSRRKEPNLDLWDFDELQKCVQDFKMEYRRGQSLKDVLEAEEKKNKSSQRAQTYSTAKEKIPVLAEDQAEKRAYDTQIKTPVLAEDQIERQTYDTQIKNQTPQKDLQVPAEESSPKLESRDLGSQKTNFIINCIKFKENELTQANNLEFLLSEPELVPGGLLKSSYYLYPVICLPLRWESKMRYSEYVWLRKIICLLLPGHFIAPLPTHKSITNSEEDIVFKRKALLSKFTFAISKNKLILSLSVVESFFKNITDNEFSKLKSSVENKLKKPEKIENFFSEDGTLACSLVENKETIIKLQQYATSSESIEKRLKRQTSTVMRDMKIVSDTYISISDLIRQLEEIQDQIPYKTEGKKTFYNKNAYKIIKNAVKSLPYLN